MSWKLKQRKHGEWYSRDSIIVINEKLRRGRCSYHPKYNNGAEHLVTVDNYIEFAFDHIDRSDKFLTISKLIGRYRDPKKLIDEMNKCVLTCHNCHMRKGMDEGDFLPPKTIEQLRLFDA